MKRIQAFTLIELVISMIISSVIISLVVGLYLNTNKAFRRTIDRYEEDEEIVFFQSLLRNDFENAVKVTERFDQFIMQQKDNKRIYYEFNESNVIRETAFLKDTFNIEIDEVSYHKLEENKELLTSISFNLLLEDFRIPVHLNKRYTKDILFNLSYKKQ